MSNYDEKERQRDFDYFLKSYKKLYMEYGHSFIVIKEKEVIGVYKNIDEAIDMTSKKHPIGTFIVQECNGDESGYTNYIPSWQLVEV